MTVVPNLQKDGWELESAVERHRTYPDRFDIPSEQERASLNVGSRVKILFLLIGHDEYGDYIQCERMWVIVTEVNESHYVGSLESRPATSDVLSPGDQIAFGPEHVATILIPRSHPPTE